MYRGKILIGLFCAVIATAILFLVLPQGELAADPNAELLPLEMLSLKTSAGKFEFTVEVADEASERQRGLMFREKMLPTHGMLFDFEETELVYMWMENTVLSLDMIFIRPDGTVAKIQTNTIPFSRDIISSGEPVSHVLELNAGLARQINLKPNDRVVHRFFE
ncbi:MAG: DUF192 domain-containing protein [Pseudomonadota bacterium]